MNLLFVHYGSLASNSLNHIGQFADGLAVRGHACVVAVTSLAEPPMFPCAAPIVTHADVLGKPGAAMFPNSFPADLVVAWTPREGVRRVVDGLSWTVGSRLVVHLEDNEDHLLETFTERTSSDLRALPDEDLEKLLPPALSHPRHWRALLLKADGVSAITPRLLEFAPDDRPSCVLTPVVPADIDARAADPAFRASLGLAPDERVVVHTGGNTVPNQPELAELYHAVHQLNRSGRKVRLLRTGPGNDGFNSWLGPDVLAHVLDLGIVSRDRIPDILALADVLVQPGCPGPFNSYRLPSKLPEFLASGRPVVMPDANLARDLVDGTHALLLHRGDRDEIASACARILDDPVLAGRLSSCALTFAATRFDARRSIDDLEDFLRLVSRTENASALRSVPTPVVAACATRIDAIRGHAVTPHVRHPASPVLDFFKLQTEWERRFLEAEARWRAAPAVTAPVSPQPPQTPETPPRLRHEAAPPTSAPAPEPAAVELACKGNPPRFSILMPVHNPDPEHVRAAIASVRHQSWQHWELCVADDASRRAGVGEVLEEAARLDPRILLRKRSERGHISAASNTALESASGEWLVLLDHDDLLAPDALVRLAERIVVEPGLWFLYSDEDKLNPNGMRADPYLKPSWSPDLLLGHHYGAHLAAFSAARVREVGGFRVGFEGAQDWDLALRVTEGATPDRIAHVPHVLYHWRMSPESTASGPGAKDYAVVAALRAAQEHLDRTEPGAKALPGPSAGSLRIRHPIKSDAKVAIITALPDDPCTLRGRLASLAARTAWSNLLVVGVEDERLSVDSLKALLDHPDPARFRRVQRPGAANVAALVNTGAASADDADVLVFLRADLSPLDPDWIHELVSHALRNNIGACGGRILDETTGTIEHAGYDCEAPEFGTSNFAGHPLGTCEWNGRPQLVTNPLAVSADCLAVKRNRFIEAGGFNESHPGAAAGFDLCMRLAAKGWRTVHTPFARLWSLAPPREPVPWEVAAHLRNHWLRSSRKSG